MKPKRKKKKTDKYTQYKRTITKLAADRDRYKERYFYMLAAYENLLLSSSLLTSASPLSTHELHTQIPSH